MTSFNDDYFDAPADPWPDDEPGSDEATLFVPGGQFILDAPAEPPAVWGDGDQVLWAEGEPFLVTGPPGVGKTSLVANVVLARIGIGPAEVLDLAVKPSRRVLYLACDRPAQIARAFRRLVSPHDRARLDEALVVWKGPPPQDVAKHPMLLLDLARQADADCIVVDSLKDVAVKLTDDEVGAAVNRAHQHVVAEGLDLAGLHHQRKAQQGSRPTRLDDLYGSTWLAAGAGSVVLLWGQPGDPVVELHHLKQPAGAVGPLVVEHDQAAGTMTVHGDTADPLTILRLAGTGGIDARVMAERLYGTTDPDRNQIRKARRRLDRLVTDRHAEKVPGRVGGDGGAEPDRYYPAQPNREIAGQSKDHAAGEQGPSEQGPGHGVFKAHQGPSDAKGQVRARTAARTTKAHAAQGPRPGHKDRPMGLGDSRKPDIGTVKCRCGKIGYGRTDLPFTCDTCTAEDWQQTVLEVAAAMNAEDGPDVEYF